MLKHGDAMLCDAMRCYAGLLEVAFLEAVLQCCEKESFRMF